MEIDNSKDNTDQQYTPTTIKEALLRIWQRKIRYNRSVVVILVISVVVMCVWFLQQLQNGQIITTTICPTYVSLPTGYTSSDLSKKKIDISVKMNGLNFLTYMIGDLPLEVDLNRVVEKAGGYHFWVPKKYPSILNDAIKENDELEKITSDTIFLNMGDETIKSVPVRISDINIKNKAGYQNFATPMVIPSVVRVIGIASQVNEINEVLLPSLSYKDVSGEVIDTVVLRTPTGAKRVRFSPEKVVVSFTSLPYTEEEIKLPIHAVNVPVGKRVKFIPSHVKVKYQVALQNYGRIDERDFRVVADMSSTSSSANVIYLTLKEKPAFVGTTTIIPDKVYYLLK